MVYGAVAGVALVAARPRLAMQQGTGQKAPTTQDVVKGNRRALSLLEILFTLGLLTIVLVAFAAVYPSAYRLNRKSAKGTIAAKTSSAVAAEILSLPFDPPSFNSSQPNLTQLSLDTNGSGAIQQFVYQNMRTSVPEGFRIRPQAIRVSLFPPPAALSTETRFAEVQVTCYWTDSNNPGLERSVTVISGKAENRDVR